MRCGATTLRATPPPRRPTGLVSTRWSMRRTRMSCCLGTELQRDLERSGTMVLRPLLPLRRPLLPLRRPLLPLRRPLLPLRRPLLPLRRPLWPRHRPLLPRHRPLLPRHRPLHSQRRPLLPRRRPLLPRRRPLHLQRRPRAQPSLRCLTSPGMAGPPRMPASGSASAARRGRHGKRHRPTSFWLTSSTNWPSTTRAARIARTTSGRRLAVPRPPRQSAASASR